MPMEREQDSDDQPGGDRWVVLADGGGHDGESGHGVWTLDPEMLTAEWSVVLPGVKYGPGNVAADRVADRVRGLYQDVKVRGAFDLVSATTDRRGNPFVHVYLTVHGMLELMMAACEARRRRGVLDSEALEAWRDALRRGPDGYRAADVAWVVRAVVGWLESRSALDGVLAMRDRDGNALAYLCLNAAGMAELVEMVCDGRRALGAWAGEAGW